MLLLALAGCSNSPEDVRADYCSSVRDQQERLSGILAEERPDALLRALPVFRELSGQAPRDVADDWTLLIEALEGLDEALVEADVDPGDYDAGDPPASVTGAQQRSIAEAADALTRPEVVAAYDGVKQQAVDVCNTPLFR
ncbi:hypothetical protein GCM10009623_00530 [Nocardioides aestuarii]